MVNNPWQGLTSTDSAFQTGIPESLVSGCCSDKKHCRHRERKDYHPSFERKINHRVLSSACDYCQGKKVHRRDHYLRNYIRPFGQAGEPCPLKTETSHEQLNVVPDP